MNSPHSQPLSNPEHEDFAPMFLEEAPCKTILSNLKGLPQELEENLWALLQSGKRLDLFKAIAAHKKDYPQLKALLTPLETLFFHLNRLPEALQIIIVDMLQPFQMLVIFEGLERHTDEFPHLRNLFIQEKHARFWSNKVKRDFCFSACTASWRPLPPPAGVQTTLFQTKLYKVLAERVPKGIARVNVPPGFLPWNFSATLDVFSKDLKQLAQNKAFEIFFEKFSFQVLQSRLKSSKFFGLCQSHLIEDDSFYFLGLTGRLLDEVALCSCDLLAVHGFFKSHSRYELEKRSFAARRLEVSLRVSRSWVKKHCLEITDAWTDCTDRRILKVLPFAKKIGFFFSSSKEEAEGLLEKSEALKKFLQEWASSYLFYTQTHVFSNFFQMPFWAWIVKFWKSEECFLRSKKNLCFLLALGFLSKKNTHDAWLCLQEAEHLRNLWGEETTCLKPNYSISYEVLGFEHETKRMEPKISSSVQPFIKGIDTLDKNAVTRLQYVSKSQRRSHSQRLGSSLAQRTGEEKEKNRHEPSALPSLIFFSLSMVCIAFIAISHLSLASKLCWSAAALLASYGGSQGARWAGI